VKPIKKETNEEAKPPKRKHLFQPKVNPLFPEELVAVTPETPVQAKNHPCYSQTEIKRPKPITKIGSQSSRKRTDEEVCSQQVLR